MNRAADKRLLDHESFVAQYLALALFTVGVANSLGSDDLLAAFAAGKSLFLLRQGGDTHEMLVFRERCVLGWTIQYRYRRSSLLTRY